MVLPEVKYTGVKLVSHSDLRGEGTSLRRTTSKKTNFKIGTWNVETIQCDEATRDDLTHQIKYAFFATIVPLINILYMILKLNVLFESPSAAAHKGQEYQPTAGLRYTYPQPEVKVRPIGSGMTCGWRVLYPSRFWLSRTELLLKFNNYPYSSRYCVGTDSKYCQNIPPPPGIKQTSYP